MYGLTLTMPPANYVNAMHSWLETRSRLFDNSVWDDAQCLSNGHGTTGWHALYSTARSSRFYSRDGKVLCCSRLCALFSSATVRSVGVGTIHYTYCRGISVVENNRDMCGTHGPSTYSIPSSPGRLTMNVVRCVHADEATGCYGDDLNKKAKKRINELSKDITKRGNNSPVMKHRIVYSFSPCRVLFACL